MAVRRKPAKPRSTSRREADEVPSVWRLGDGEIERLLRSGRQAPLLQEYFGGDPYRTLRDMAREAAATRTRGGPRVLVLPGIMGSKLGRKRGPFDDVVWIDPIEIAAGRMAKLALPDQGRHVALGVVLFTYLKLKLRLQIAGFDAAFHPFDWRQDIERLGKQLATRIAGERAREVHVVAHSMGGLVTRAALASDRRLKLGRFVMLGTPNYGSFVPVQTLRAQYPLVRKLAALDLKNSVERLARDVFTTFSGLIGMLPSPERFQRVDLYDERSWPDDGMRPSGASLRRAREVQELLADADERFCLVAGVNQRTVTGMFAERAGSRVRFRFEESLEGDGSVPLALALLPGARTWYVEEAHGGLPNNGAVGDAVVELLERGETSRLARQWARPAEPGRRVLESRTLEAQPFEGRRGAEVTAAERRELVAELLSPTARPAPTTPGAAAPSAPDAGYAHGFERVVVGRRRQRHIEIRLALGSITEVRSDAYVLGAFEGVDPAGAVAALDERMDGAVKEFTTRRMISGRVGEVFVLPTGRHPLFADMLVLAGLGAVDGFDDEVQQFVAENVARTLIRSYVDEFATVLLGAGSGRSVTRSLYNHLLGFFRGLGEADLDQTLRRIVLCEFDPDKYLEMKEEIYRLASTSLFDDFQVTIDEITLPPPPPPPASRRASAGDGSSTMYLVVREEAGRWKRGKQADSATVWRSTVLTPTGKAAILSGAREFRGTELSRLLARIDGDAFTFASLRGFGQELARLVLAPDVLDGLQRVLAGNPETQLVVVHDATASRIPWETLCIEGAFPAAEGGLSRRYAADDLSVAKWLEERRDDREMRVLLVVNPTEDLDGAAAEAEHVRAAFRRSDAGRLDTLEGPEATRRALLAAFRSGRYDVIHYAGHAEFNAAQPALSGIVCHGDEMLTGAELAGLSKLPALVFFNACESGRIRGRKPGLGVAASSAASARIRALIDQNVGLAEAFMRGGVTNYIGTYWPVGDAAASAFAEVFYRRLSAGASIGSALREGRKKVKALRSVDWADYIHYGAADFALKPS